MHSAVNRENVGSIPTQAARGEKMCRRVKVIGPISDKKIFEDEINKSLKDGWTIINFDVIGDNNYISFLAIMGL